MSPLGLGSLGRVLIGATRTTGDALAAVAGEGLRLLTDTTRAVRTSIEGPDGPARTTLPAGGRGVGGLLQSSSRQSAPQARAELLRRLVAQLVPDESRVLALLAEEGPQATISVGPRRGGAPTIEHASSLGRTAALAAPELGPIYVARLLALGLLEVGPQLDELSDDYAVILTDAPVRQAVERASDGRLRPAARRRASVRLSPLGRELLGL